MEIFATKFAAIFCRDAVTPALTRATWTTVITSTFENVDNLVDGFVPKVIRVGKIATKFVLRVNGRIQRKQF